MYKILTISKTLTTSKTLTISKTLTDPNRRFNKLLLNLRVYYEKSEYFMKYLPFLVDTMLFVCIMINSWRQ